MKRKAPPPPVKKAGPQPIPVPMSIDRALNMIMARVPGLEAKLATGRPCRCETCVQCAWQKVQRLRWHSLETLPGDGSYIELWSGRQNMAVPWNVDAFRGYDADRIREMGYTHWRRVTDPTGAVVTARNQ